MKPKFRLPPIGLSGMVKRLLVFLVTATMSAVLLTVVWASKPAPGAVTEAHKKDPAGMPVTVRSVEAADYPAMITAFGEVVPLWQTTIKTQVDGAIEYVSERLQTGNIVRGGELLVRIAKSDFKRQVAEAQSRLAAASVNLLKEEREGWEARKHWTASGLTGQPASGLVWRQPQLKAAQAEVRAAQAALAQAALQGAGEVTVELKKVTWPSKQEVINTTTVVVIASFIFGIYLYLCDLVFLVLRNKLFEIFKVFC